jgi:hypothetical protein
MDAKRDASHQGDTADMSFKKHLRATARHRRTLFWRDRVTIEPRTNDCEQIAVGWKERRLIDHAREAVVANVGAWSRDFDVTRANDRT